jgi:hypothetical protein
MSRMFAITFFRATSSSIYLVHVFLSAGVEFEPNLVLACQQLEAFFNGWQIEFGAIG